MRLRGAALALALAAALPLLLPPPAVAQPAPSVQVQTSAAKRGSLPDIVTAFGTAGAAIDGSVTISLQNEGRVARLAVTPGQAVTEGQALLDFAFSPAAISAYQQAQHALTLAQSERAHTAQLLAQQLATRAQLAQADKAVADAQSALAALQREGAGSAQTQVTAPFAGIVTAIAVAQGDRVAAGAALVTLLRADGMVVTVGIEPALRGRISPGQAVALTALTSGAEQNLAGKILRIDGMLNPKTRLINADVATDAPLLPGESFRAAITAGAFTGWVVPRNAVQSDAQGAYVFQTAAGKAVRVPVTIAGSQGDLLVIEGTLDVARPLVVEGNYQLSDGAAVREAPMQQASGQAGSGS